MSTFRRKPVALKTALKKVIQASPQHQEYVRAEIITSFGTIVGKQIDAQCVDKRFFDTTLVLRIPDSAWRNEIFMQRFDILKKINEFAKKKVVHEIRIKG